MQVLEGSTMARCLNNGLEVVVVNVKTKHIRNQI
jgi:hypothetical protein